MKLIYNPTRLAALVFVSLIMFGSCQKESSPDATSQEEFTSQASSEADAESDDIFNEVFDNVLGVNADVGFGGTGVFGQMNPGSSGGTARGCASRRAGRSAPGSRRSTGSAARARRRSRAARRPRAGARAGRRARSP